MKSVAFKGAKVAYQLEGKGVPVVFLHGFCEDSRMWNDFKQDLLEEKYRVLSIDLPGFGESEVVASPTIDYYADAVVAVMDACKLEKVVLIGHSMGGYTALSVAEQAIDRLYGVGLFHSHPYADTQAKKEDRMKQVRFIERHGHQLYVKQLVPKLFQETYAKTNPFDLDKLIHRAARYKEEGIIGGLHAMANRSDRSELLKSISCPVLFIVGDEDEAVPKDGSLKQLALPPVASVHCLLKVAHMGMIEARKSTQLIVRQFADFCIQQLS